MFKGIIEKIVNDVLISLLGKYKITVAQKMYDKISVAIDNLPLGDAIETELKRALESILEEVVGEDIKTEFDIMGIETAEGEGEEADPIHGV